MRLTLMGIAALAVLLSACGGSSTGGETTAEKLPGAPPPVLPLPTDPWAVIPDGRGVLTADIAAIRASVHGPFLRQLGRSLCIDDERAHIYENTDRIVGAGGPEGMLIAFKGRYTDAELQMVLDQMSEKAPAGTQTTERMYKRIRIVSRGAVTGARIGGELMVFGHPREVEKAAALAEGEKAPLLHDGALFTSHGLRAEIAANTLVLAGQAQELKVRRMSNAFGAVGLPKDLLDGALVGTLNITANGADVGLRVIKASAQSAAAAAEAIRRKLGQLSLLARLAGLPPILEKTEARASDAVLHITLSASTADLEVLRGRLTEALAESPPPCGL